MSIEQLEIRPEDISVVPVEDLLPQLVAQEAALRLAEQRRRDQLFNLSGQATGITRPMRDPRLGLPRSNRV